MSKHTYITDGFWHVSTAASCPYAAVAAGTLS